MEWVYGFASRYATPLYMRLLAGLSILMGSNRPHIPSPMTSHIGRCHGCSKDFTFTTACPFLITLLGSKDSTCYLAHGPVWHFTNRGIRSQGLCRCLNVMKSDILGHRSLILGALSSENTNGGLLLILISVLCYCPTGMNGYET